jgi:hypothetical protein
MSSATTLEGYVKERLIELPKMLDDKEIEEGQKPNIRKAIEMYKNKELLGPKGIFRASYIQDGQPTTLNKIHGNSLYWREVSIIGIAVSFHFAKSSLNYGMAHQ